MEVQAQEKKFNRLINMVSIAVPLVVAILFGVKIPNVEPLSFLPPIYASINGLTAVLLIVSLVAIKNKKIKLQVRGSRRNAAIISTCLENEEVVRLSLIHI